MAKGAGIEITVNIAPPETYWDDVWLKKPGKMRWEYKSPSPQQIVSDGASLWVYTPELNQVNKGSAPKALISVSWTRSSARSTRVIPKLDPARVTPDRLQRVADPLRGALATVAIVVFTLVIARPVAVWVALMGTDTDAPTRLFMGWFGPIGANSGEDGRPVSDSRSLSRGRATAAHI